VSSLLNLNLIKKINIFLKSQIYHLIALIVPSVKIIIINC